MFTGIIQSLGTIEKIDTSNNSYYIKTDLKLNDCKIGSSICCDGVCLTAIDIKDNIFKINIGEETLKKSNLVNWKIGHKVNLEKSLRVGDEIAGHFVYGHVDLTLKIKNINTKLNSWEFEFFLFNKSKLSNFKKFIVEKGSVAINGISLTISDVFEDSFSVSIIPHTFKNTNLCFLKKNDIVNIEYDPLARYVGLKYE